MKFFLIQLSLFAVMAEWQCSVCTVKNIDDTSKVCEVCRTSKEAKPREEVSLVATTTVNEHCGRRFYRVPRPEKDTIQNVINAYVDCHLSDQKALIAKHGQEFKICLTAAGGDSKGRAYEGIRALSPTETLTSLDRVFGKNQYTLTIKPKLRGGR